MFFTKASVWYISDAITLYVEESVASVPIPLYSPIPLMVAVIYVFASIISVADTISPAFLFMCSPSLVVITVSLAYVYMTFLS